MVNFHAETNEEYQSEQRIKLQMEHTRCSCFCSPVVMDERILMCSPALCTNIIAKDILSNQCINNRLEIMVHIVRIGLTSVILR